MALNSHEMYLLAQVGTLRQRLKMLALVVAGEVAAEDHTLLTGNLTEHKSRFTLAQDVLSPSSILAETGAMGVAVSLREVLSVPTPINNDERIEQRIERLAESIDDDLLLASIRGNWSFVSGFDVVSWVAENP